MKEQQQINAGQRLSADGRRTKERDLQARYEALQHAHLRLQESERLRQDLVNMLVHDLKVPLSVILSSLELLRDEQDQDSIETRDAILDIAHHSAQEMLQLITDLLEMQRLEAGQMPLRLQPVDLAQILHATVDQARRLAEQKGVALHLRLSEPAPWAWADSHLTARVVMNLVENAIKNTPYQGEVRITGQAATRETIISVADSGPGIPTGHRDHLFDKFSQIGCSTRNGQGSVGLGLAFCKMAVEAQRGWIAVESGPESGALFRFGLPLWRTAGN
jgi:signal transduction histidine kinase